jgi:hypothetical protein
MTPFSLSTKLKLGLAAAAIALVGAATAIAGGNQVATTTTLVLQGKQVPSSVHFVDDAPAGESAGDTISFSQTLYANHRHVGFAEVSGTLLDNKRHDADNLTGTLILRDGTIVLQGTSLGKAATQHLAIVGGTGAYADTRGEAVITNGPTLTTMRLLLNRY